MRARKTSCTCRSTSVLEARGMPSERLVLRPPEAGHKILIAERWLRVPDDPIIPPIEGDGIGPEDVCAGIAWASGSPEARRLGEILDQEFHARVRRDSGMGVKPVSGTGSRRLVRRAMRYAIDSGRKSVTLGPRGNIMKYTEGA